MKKIFMIIAIIIAPGQFTVTNAIHETTPGESFVPFPGPYAEAVHRYVTIEDPYQKWDLWPGKGKLFKARPPLDHITTYVNDNALYSVKAGKRMANGSMIVTENYTEGEKLSAIFIMYKISGYNPSAGDWYWAQYDVNGKAIVEGKAEACIECHTKMKDNDYIFTDKFVK